MADAASERWQRIDRLYHEALATPAANRAAFLAHACGDDALLHSELESLLALDDSADDFLERPALEQTAALDTPKPGALAGRQIGGYDVLSLLGAGGMGEVYLARDLRLGREVALKILRGAVATDPMYLQRFEDEARSASILNHPNIVTIYGVGDEHGVAYIAMERVQGRTLREIVANGRLPLGEVLDLAVQLSDALTHAHANGIVHRDLKPDNVMVTPEGLAKVLDFGIAKRENTLDRPLRSAPGADAETSGTEGGTILGTVGYMSPEQAARRPARPASDQFSFGAILYEMVTGRRAFERSTSAATIDAILREDPEPIRTIAPDVPPALQHIIERCLVKTPDTRFAVTRDLADALRRCRADRERAERASVLWRRFRRFGAVAAAIAVPIVFGLWQLWWREPPDRSLAVLPFVSATTGEDIAYLGEGVTEALIQRLFGLPHLVVTARDAVVSVAKSTAVAREMGHQLGVETVLTGSVQASDGRLGVTTELVDVASGNTLWRESYDRPRQDLVDIQDAIATSVVNTLDLRVPDDLRRRLLQRPTNDSEAYDNYLRGLHLQRQDEPLEARTLFDRAIARDANFAAAHVAYAGTYWTMLIDGEMRPTEGWPVVNRALDRALQLDPSLPGAHAGLAWVKFAFDWNWSAAEREWEIALSNPARDVEPETLFGYALEQWATGHADRAVLLMQRARKMNPFAPEMKNTEADFHLHLGQFEEAERLYRAAIKDAPEDSRPYFGLAQVYRERREYDQAIAMLREAYEVVGNVSLLPVLAAARGEGGLREIDRAAATLELRALQQAAASTYISPLLLAGARARVGQVEAALTLLEAAHEQAAPGLVFLNVDRTWESVRSDPRFLALVDAVGLPRKK